MSYERLYKIGGTIMTLTIENRSHIDSLSHYDLLYKIRFAPVGDEWMQGETGAYWLQRRETLRQADLGGAVADSKALGWG
jgi:hypothetical protein